jgi:phosphonate transport system substrate-binding protein
MNPEGATEPVSIGLNPLFLDSDIQLLSLIQSYLAAQLGRTVQLIKRRTYQEITALLLSGQLDAAWICDDPYVQHEDQFALRRCHLPARAALSDLRDRQRGEQGTVF